MIRLGRGVSKRPAENWYRQGKRNFLFQTLFAFIRLCDLESAFRTIISPTKVYFQCTKTDIGTRNQKSNDWVNYNSTSPCARSVAGYRDKNAQLLRCSGHLWDGWNADLEINSNFMQNKRARMFLQIILGTVCDQFKRITKHFYCKINANNFFLYEFMENHENSVFQWSGINASFTEGIMTYIGTLLRILI